MRPREFREVELIEKKYWAIRERYWLQCLFETIYDRCILPIGANHV